jgi:hypothetical protein
MFGSGVFRVLLLTLIVCLWCANGSMLASADFVDGATETWMYAYINPVGLSFTMPEVIDLFNSSLFRGYLLNSNIYGDWYSNF